MSEPNKGKVIAKQPYSTPKLVDYGSVLKLTEAKSNGQTDATSATKHNA